MKRRKKKTTFQSKVFKNKRKLAQLIKLASKKTYSAPRLAEIFDCNKKTIFKTLRTNNIFLPNLGRFKSRIYYNKKFFVNLSAISAYWAGFVAADGCLSYKNKSLHIGLNMRDKEHLCKFANAIKTNAKIGYAKSNNSTRINIYSKEIFNSLSNLGITPNKSLNIANINIPNHLTSHFIRGVFDGDGYLGGKKITHIQFFISGNKPFLKRIQSTLINECNINRVKLYPLYPLGTNRGYKLQYTGSQVFKILDFLYNDSTPQTRLDRKYRRALYLRNTFGKAKSIHQ